MPHRDQALNSQRHPIALISVVSVVVAGAAACLVMLAAGRLPSPRDAPPLRRGTSPYIIPAEGLRPPPDAPPPALRAAR